MAKLSARSAAQRGRAGVARKPETVRRKPAPQLSPALAAAAARQARPEGVLALQQQVGNRAVSRWLAPERVQTRLVVGPAHDAHEAEAERVAGQVVRRLASGPQRLPEAEPAVRAGVQRAGGEAGFEAGPSLERALAASRGSGQPLPDGVRSPLEQSFGADFSRVRVHTGSQAAQLSRDLSAQAFTHGSDVYFAAGKYNPASTSGQHLLAHELTHVVQQTKAGLRRKPNRIQRYAAQAYKTGVKVDWLKETSLVTKSNEGASGGVYFFNSPFQPVTRLVVKPEYLSGDNVAGNKQEGQGRSALPEGQFADAAPAKAASLQAPSSRLVDPQGAEGTAIRLTAGAKGPGIAPHLDAGIEGVKSLAFLKVMAAAGGQSVGSAAAQAESAWDVNLIVTQLDDDAVLRKIGRLIAADAFMGNPDRINTARATAAGNLMFGGRAITAIDSEALFNKLASTNIANLDRALALLSDLFTKKDQFVDRFMEGILSNLPPESDAYREFKRIKTTDQLRWKPRLGRFIDEGIQALISTLTSGTKSMLKRELEAWQKVGSGVSDWSTFRAREKYLRLRAAGLDHDRARQLVADYVLYRERRRGRFKGLKWTVKFL
jgi:hypothetical protein